MSSNGSTFSTGPAPAPGETLVHIIFVPLNVAGGAVTAGNVSADGLKQIAAHVGKRSSTDIIVFAGKPFHFTKDGVLLEHEEAHLHVETLLRLHRRRNERAVWWSERSFSITSIRPAAPLKLGAASYPFAIEPRTQQTVATDDKQIFIARSTIPLEAADDQHYKIAFTIDGEPEPVDPNMVCDPSP
jgi:hypothetical protein